MDWHSALVGVALILIGGFLLSFAKHCLEQAAIKKKDDSLKAK